MKTNDRLLVHSDEVFNYIMYSISSTGKKKIRRFYLKIGYLILAIHILVIFKTYTQKHIIIKGDILLVKHNFNKLIITMPNPR